MIFQVIVHAFSQPVIRLVEVPEAEYNSVVPNTSKLLELIFHYGQNDIQERECPSVSVGDLILLYDNFGGSPVMYRVNDFGFTKLDKKG